MNYRWSLAAPAPATNLSPGQGLSPILIQCLVNRGQREPADLQAYLQPRLKSLSDPFLLPNLEAAVDRLYAARQRVEPVVVFGDYDVDGVTSTVLLVEVLQGLGWQVQYYLPHRFDDGYGLSREAVERCLESHPTTLLVAVDCGSTAVETIAWLQGRGIDVLVLDHHQMASPPPAAKALVNPQLSRPAAPPNGLQPPDPLAPCAHLCSVGLAFKLAHALVKRGRQQGLQPALQFDLRSVLDLVALGTIADLVPLVGENRLLVAAGLERIEATVRTGLRYLNSLAQVDSPISVQAVAFQIAPRLNAAGRLENAESALRLLLARDPRQAEPLARDLDARNRQRQAIERGIVAEVLGMLRTRFNPLTDFVIVEGKTPWHIGVVGIVAARVLRQFYRPTIIFGGDGQDWRGSGRSIEGFDLAAALATCDDLLLRHGGHAMAAGLTVKPEQIDGLRSRLNSLARQTLKPEQLQPALCLDAAVSLGDLTLDLLDELAQLEPVGQGNPPVQFVVCNLHCRRPPQRIGKQQQHLKLWVTDGVHTLEAVGWGMGQSLPPDPFDLAFAPRLNEYSGRRSVQLHILAWRPAS